MGEAIVVYHTLDDRPAALHWLAEAVSRGFGVEVLRRNPALASLHEDPDFHRIIEERSAVAAERAPLTESPGGRP